MSVLEYKGMKTLFMTLVVSLFLVSCVTSRFKNGVEVVDKQTARKPCNFEGLNYDRKSFNQFHTHLVKILGRNPASISSKTQLVKEVTYPLVVNNAKETKIYQSPKEVTENFDNIFNPNTVNIIRAQRVADINCSLKGINYGDGVVWVELDENKKFKIYSINHL